MKAIRLGIGLLLGYVRSHQKSFLVGVVVSVAAILYLPKLGGYLFTKPPVTVGMVGNYTLSTLPREIQNELSVGLVALQEDGTVIPAAAKSWVATDSGKTLVFKLNPDLFWSDGTRLDASQVNYNLKGVEISRPDKLTIRFTLKEPFAPLLPLLAQPLFKSGLVGLGVNRVTDVQFNGRFLASLRLTNLKTKTTLIYKFYPTEKELILALKLGSVKRATGLYDAQSLQTLKSFHIESIVNNHSQAIVFFNLQKKYFDDKTFRQSLIYALPNNFPGGETADSPIARHSWVGNILTKKYPQNLEVAKKTLEKVASGSALPKIVLSTSRELKNTAEIVAASWQELGLLVTVSVTDSRPINFDAFLTLVDLPVDPDQYVLWHSTQTGNIAGYKSFKVDKLLEEGRRETDLEKRKTIYENFQKAITEDVPAAFLFYPKVYTVWK